MMETREKIPSPGLLDRDLGESLGNHTLLPVRLRSLYLPELQRYNPIQRFKACLRRLENESKGFCAVSTKGIRA